MKASRRIVAFAGCLLAATSPLAVADGQALDPVSIWLGGYYANTEVDVHAETNDGVSTGNVNLEKGDDTVARARVDVLLFGSQGLEFDYYTLSHSSTNTLTQPFDYLGIPFEANSLLRGKFEFSAGSAAYHWWMHSGDDVFGIGLGATYYQTKLKVDGTAIVDGESAATSSAWDESAVAPLVTVAWRHAMSDSLRIYVDASGIYKSGGPLSGHLYDVRGGVEWFPWRNVGLAAEYGATRIKLNRESTRYDADLDVKLNGPSLFARFRF
jgi:hypothetical protein